MISKIICDIPFVIAPKVQAQVLYYVAKNMSGSIKSYDGMIQIMSGNIELEYDGGKVNVSCSQEWITVMRVLNNISLDTKKLISRVLEKCWSKLLLMIDIVLMMRHCDIIFTLLMIIFDMLQFGHTYDICTYVNIDNVIRPLLCYSTICGFGCNMYGLSNGLINYFDAVHNVSDYESLCEKTKGRCSSGRTIDSEQKLFLIAAAESAKTIVIGKVTDSEGLMFVYFVNKTLMNLGWDERYITSQIKLLCTKGSVFHKIIVEELGICAATQCIVRINHNIVDGVLC